MTTALLVVLFSPCTPAARPMAQSGDAAMQPASTSTAPDDYEAAPVVRRERARHRARCMRDPLFRPVLDRFQHNYRSLERILLVDGKENTLGVNGMGNIFGDYVLWLALAVASDRALFIDWTGGGIQQRFDLAYFYTGRDGADWAWEGDARRRVEEAHLSNKLLELPAFPREEGQTGVKTSCISIWEALRSSDPMVTIKLAQGSSIALTPLCEPTAAPKDEHGDRGSGGLEQSDQDDPSVYANATNEAINSAGQPGQSDQEADPVTAHESRLLRTALEASHTALYQDAAVDGPGEFLKLDTLAKLGLAYHAAKLAVDNGNETQAATLLYALASDEPPTEESVAVFEGRPLWMMTANADESPDNTEVAGKLGACLLNDFTQPRRRLREALSPYLAALRDADSLVAVQARTGWSDDLLSIPDELEGPSANASDVLRDQLVSAGNETFEGSLRSVLGRSPADMMLRLASIDDLDRNPGARNQSRTRKWASLVAVAERYGRLDVLDVLQSPTARWQLLNTADSDGFERAGWGTPSPDEHLQHCSELLQRPADAKPVLQGLRVTNPAWPDAAPLTPLAATLECAVMVAMAVAEQRAAENTTDWLGAIGTGHSLAVAPAAQGWRLHVSSDAPGLIAMFESLPALEGHVLGCIGKACVEHETATSQDSQRARRDSADSLQVAIDLWFHVNADHVMQASSSSMTTWSVRSPGALRDQKTGSPMPHVINPLSEAGGGFAGRAGDKQLPLCDALPEPRPPGDEHPHPAHDDCLALRWAVLSSVAARALRNGSRTQGAVRAAVSAARVQTGFHRL